MPVAAGKRAERGYAEAATTGNASTHAADAAAVTASARATAPAIGSR